MARATADRVLAGLVRYARNHPYEAAVALLAVCGITAFAVVTLVPALMVTVSESTLETWNCVNSLMAAALCLLRAWRSGPDRTAWMCIAGGFAVYVSGDVAFLLFVHHLDPMPVPSVADLLWLAMFPGAYAGIVLLLRRRLMGLPLSAWLDGLIGGLGTAAVATAFFFGPVVAQTGGTSAEVATLISFIAGDLLLLGLVVAAMSMLGWSLSRSWMLLAGGLLTFAVADTVYLVQVTNDTFELGTPLDLSWVLATLAVAFAAGPPDRLHHARRSRGAAVTMPTFFAASSLLVLAGHSTVSDVGANLAVATLALALGRLGLAHYELRTMAHDRALARTDELTGLANRRAFSELLEHDLIRSRRHSSQERCALLLVDLDRFKEVNDSLGHAVGDQLLHLAGQRMLSRLRKEDTLARWGGDEFAVLLQNAGEEEATVVAADLGAALCEPFPIADLTLHLGGSIGVALYPDHADEAGELLRQADVAMYEAKRSIDGVRIYQAASDDHGRERVQMLDQVRSALLDPAQMIVHYQPKALLPEGRIVGVEALVRWRHPTRGLLFPDVILPLINEAGLMRELTICVMRQSVRQCAAWRESGLELAVSVNLSASSVIDYDLPELIGALLVEAGLPGRLLEVEITEDFLLGDRVRAHSVLSRIRELGVRVSVDDYGTGYSSLAYLRDLPVDTLKLDRSFIMPMSADPTAAAIVRSTVSLAHSLGLDMVAEGVEDAAAWDELASYGCDQAQGYFLSRPVAPDVLVEWLTERGHAAAAGTDINAALPRPRQTDHSVTGTAVA